MSRRNRIIKTQRVPGFRIDPDLQMITTLRQIHAWTVQIGESAINVKQSYIVLLRERRYCERGQRDKAKQKTACWLAQAILRIAISFWCAMSLADARGSITAESHMYVAHRSHSSQLIRCSFFVYSSTNLL